MLTGHSYPGYTGTLPDDHLRALRKLLDEIEEEAEFEATYGMPPKGLEDRFAKVAVGEHWPKRPSSDNTPDSDQSGDSDLDTAQQQSSDLAR
jgi:hypothetical protein